MKTEAFSLGLLGLLGLASGQILSSASVDFVTPTASASSLEPSSSGISGGNATTTLTPARRRRQSCSPRQAPTISKVDGLRFNIDGTTAYYAGTNCYWIGFLTDDDDVDTAMSQIGTSGLRILRVWGFNDVNTIPSEGTVYYQYLPTDGSEPQINTGADGLQRLDAVVAAAEKYGVKLIINFVNNWNDYGGINAYVTAFGGNSTTWFTDEKSQAQYHTYIAAVISRYINSTAVFAWELANEPRCHGCGTSVIYNWAEATSAYIKGLDPDHMVTMGDEGFGLPGDGSYPYTYDEGVDWAQNLEIPTLDFATLHLYPDSWGTNTSWGNPWISNHAQLCQEMGKPCYLEEYGVPSNHCAVEGPWERTSLASIGSAGDSFWDFGTVLDGSYTANDTNTIFYNTSDWDCLVTQHIADIATAMADEKLAVTEK